MFADVHGGKGPPVRFGSAAKASIPPKSDPMARIHCVFRIAMCGTKPSQIVRPGSSRSPEGNCNGQQVGWDAKPRQRRALFPTCRALTGDSRNATRRRGFSLYRAWPYAVTQAGGRFELPAVLEYRQRSGFGDDKLQFQFRFHRCDANFGTAPGDASGR